MITHKDILISGSDFHVSLNKLLQSKKVKDIIGYISFESEVQFHISYIEFDDNTILHIEAEHNNPYLPYNYKQPNMTEETLLSLFKESRSI